MYFKNSLSNLRSSQIKQAAETKAESPTWALNLYFSEWEGIQALYSHIFAFYWSLVWYQEFLRDSEAFPVVPHIGPRIGLNAGLQTLPLWLLIADGPSLKHQTPRDTMLLILHNVSHQAAFQTTPTFIALQVQCASLTRFYYSLSTRFLYLHWNIIEGEVLARLCS